MCSCLLLKMAGFLLGLVPWTNPMNSNEHLSWSPNRIYYAYHISKIIIDYPSKTKDGQGSSPARNISIYVPFFWAISPKDAAHYTRAIQFGYEIRGPAASCLQRGRCVSGTSAVVNCWVASKVTTMKSTRSTPPRSGSWRARRMAPRRNGAWNLGGCLTDFGWTWCFVSSIMVNTMISHELGSWFGPSVRRELWGSVRILLGALIFI